MESVKASAEALSDSTGTTRSMAGVLADLFKARLSSLVLLTTLVGYYLGSEGSVQVGRLLHTLLGTALLAAGAAALNQFLEREYDARMERTADRPLPSGRLLPETALVLGAACSIAGMLYLWLAVNALSAFLGAVTLTSYLFIYTPLKRITTLNTVIGAIPGALPPLMGWTAAQGELSAGGWALFGVLFFWQLPHFLAIAWLYREDYARGGFVMLPLIDPEGRRTGAQALAHTLGLLWISLMPVALGMVGALYMAGALILGALFVYATFRFARGLTAGDARRLFFASILYLPLLLTLMVLSKIPKL